MEVLFKNKTIISREKINKTERYAGIYRKYIELSLKLFICTFIIICCLCQIMNRGLESMIYLMLAMYGIKEAITNIKPQTIKEFLIYKFYEEYFEVSNNEQTLQISYDAIKRIREDEKNYYIILKKCGMFIDKDNFLIGSKDELLQFLQNKIKK